MNEIIEKIKKRLSSLNDKKNINKLFIILLGSIIVLIIANIVLEPKKVNNEDNFEYNNSMDYEFESDYSKYLESKLIRILSKLKDVGKVDVMIALENSSEKITATNTTKTTENTVENDAEGGTREIKREDTTTQVVTRGNDGSLLVIEEIKPIIKGVIVVAEGAGNPEVKEILYDAVKTVLGVKGNKVEIYSSK